MCTTYLCTVETLSLFTQMRFNISCTLVILYQSHTPTPNRATPAYEYESSLCEQLSHPACTASHQTRNHKAKYLIHFNVVAWVVLVTFVTPSRIQRIYRSTLYTPQMRKKFNLKLTLSSRNRIRFGVLSATPPPLPPHIDLYFDGVPPYKMRIYIASGRAHLLVMYICIYIYIYMHR